jgi:ribose transport system permease protein
VRRFAGTYATELQLLAALAVLWAIFAGLKPSVFVTELNTADMARIGGILLVVAIGEMFALVVGGFDLSVSVNMGFSATMMAYFVQIVGIPLEWSIVLGLAVGAGVGFVNGVLIAVLRVNPLIATLGTATALLGLGFYPNGSKPYFGLPPTFALNFGVGDWGPFPATIGIAAIVVLAVWLFLSRTKAGLYIYAIGGNREMCRQSGVPVASYTILAYTLCGLLAGLAGLMLGARIGIINADIGYTSGYELEAIAAAVIGGALIGGGVGRISGVVLGVAVLTVLDTGLDILGVNDFRQKMVTGVVLLGAVLISRARAVRVEHVRQTLQLARWRLAGPRQGLVEDGRPAS